MIVIRHLRRERTCAFLRTHARRRQFITYRALSRHYGFADQDWPYLAPLLYRHLDLCLKLCASRADPLWPFLVVSRDALETGAHSPRRLKQMQRALRPAAPEDFADFVAQQQNRCFREAKHHRPLSAAHLRERYQKPERYRLVYPRRASQRQAQSK